MSHSEEPADAWIRACERLWGPDWITPAAEVIGVNKRTLERAKSGSTSLNPRICADLERLGNQVGAGRAYGDVLRRIARGETPEEIEAYVQEIRHGLARYRSDLRRFTAIATLAAP